MSGTMRIRALALAGVAAVCTPVAWYAVASGGDTPEMIQLGRHLFEHNWTVNDPLAVGGDGLGPVFNERSCLACHFQGGVGGAGPNQFNVATFQVRPTVGQPNVQEGVIHAEAIPGVDGETIESVRRMHPIIPGGLRVSDGCSVRTADLDPLEITQINTPALFGLGLLDEIPGWAIHVDGMTRTVAAASRELQADFTAVPPGKARVLPNHHLGKFGWKGQFSSLEDFIAAACAMELGLSNPQKRQPAPGRYAEDDEAPLDLSRRQLSAMVAFVRSLPRPVQVLPADPAQRRQAIRGERVFAEIGCAECHTPDLGGVEGLYSDLRLHDVGRHVNGSAYGPTADDAPLWPHNVPKPDEWKTPPLWGVADTAPYFHDGASSTLLSAVSRHGGEARLVTQRYQELAVYDQEALLAFLNTLRAPPTPPSAEAAAATP